MHQAIPYRSWRLDLHNPTTHFTPQPLNVIDNNKSNKNSSNLNLSSCSVSVLKKGSNNQQGIMVLNMVSENAVIVFGRRGCCMSHVVKRLLQGLGVNPAIYEVDDENDEESVAKQLEPAILVDNNKKMQFPAVFIGGKLFGGLDRVMATHISGELVPLLKQAGALWL